DRHSSEHTQRDGVHIAALAGAWIAAVGGFGGMRDHDGQLTFAPRLPSRLERLAFRLRFRGRLLKVDLNKTHAVYSLLDGIPLEIEHHGEKTGISGDQPVHPATPPAGGPPPPEQPPGRAPRRRVDALAL